MNEATAGVRLSAAELMRNLIILAASLLGFALAAKADPIPMPPELKAFVERPEQKQAVLEIMGRQWQTVVENCSSPKVQTMGILINVPPKFDSNGVPISGEWLMVGQIQGCGATRVFTVAYGFAPDGQMKRVGLLPGTTHAGPLLQRDSLKFAMAGMASLTPKDCTDFKFIDTKFIDYETAGAGRRPWTEEWTVRACGVTGIVTMRFLPDATGTNIVSETSKTRRINP
jgi:hypothetical protein